jgi:hypothetical protein
MGTSRLRNVPVDPHPVPSSLSLAELQRLAFARLYPASTIAEEDIPDNVIPNLYTRTSYLSTKARDGITLADLGFAGSLKEPLDIFVALTSDINDKSSMKPQLGWGFKSTDRGMATFSTSLSIMLKEISADRICLEDVIDALWELTHFPPALLAFRELYETLGSEPDTLSHAVLAQTIRELSLKMVPPWISSAPENVLEASRQIFAWLHATQPLTSSSPSNRHALIHRVWFRELRDESIATQAGEIRVDVPTTDASGSDLQKHIFVTLDSSENVDPRTIAISLDGCYDTTFGNYCLEYSTHSTLFMEHKRVPSLHPSDFDNLLQTTNYVHAFRMTGPLQLADTPSSAFPVITLSQAGFVSLYESHGNWACDDGYFATFNVVEGQARMPETNPGQYLLQKLEPIISARKKEGSWEVDSWAQSDALTDSTTPDEAIVVCIDISTSMRVPMAMGWLPDETVPALVGGRRPPPVRGTQLSRFSEVKDVFKNLITRIAAYRLATHIGLVTFSSQTNVRMHQPLTGVLLNFRDQLDAVTTSRGTAMWDGIIKSKEMLVAHKALHPNTKCRIIVLTDGEDNASRALPVNVCTQLYRDDIVLDAVVIGTNKTSDLFKIAKHTGGYAFHPQTRAALYQVFLLETFIDMKMRPDIVKVPLSNFNTSVPKRVDMADVYNFPPCRPHDSEKDHYIALRDADRFFSNLSRNSGSTPSSQPLPARSASMHSWSHKTSFSRSNTISGGSIMTGTTMGASGSTRVLLAELKAMIDNQHDFMDVYVSENNMGFWKVVMQGPPASPYENGTFLLYVELGDQFPRRAPTARFITPVLHPNITKVSLVFFNT